MLSYNELKPGKFIVLDGQPYQVMEYNFLRMQQRKPVTQTKLKNLITAKVMEKTFHPADKIDEAEIEAKEIKYLYSNRGEFWFCEKDSPKERFNLPEEIAGNCAGFMKDNSLVEAIVFNEEIIGIKLPVKIDLKVVEAPPSTRGDTAQGGTKQVKLETGAYINVPLFINEGDVVKVNTETREYVGRAEKNSPS